MFRPAKLKFRNFEVKFLSPEISDLTHYFSSEITIRRKIYEVCLEPCLNGFDVAVYDDLNLVLPKKCTNLDNGDSPELSGTSVIKALDIANDLTKKVHQMGRYGMINSLG